MKDSEFVRALQAVFDANDPSDGIDRGDGYGRDHRIESVRIVESEDGFDDLEVTVRANRKAITARLLFDSAWRTASGLDQVNAYAAYVAAMWSSAVSGRGSAGPLSGHAAEDVEVTLKRGCTDVSRTAPDVVSAVDRDGESFFVHVSAQQWQDFVVSQGDDAMFALNTMIDSRWDDENHLVFFRGALHQSIRAELPPVRSMLLRDPSADGSGSARTSER
ncbi:hypothetical protein C6I20_10050 [Aeromicrobium sp. A1-2]|uniref:hypothetical protein n=1 Tax=Aeromicrobium sp. A1-2 TaxID=2107713 RepID=UPI000E4BBC67|nr:hypothetical protein [Aeromicrobium sp. A1-2]AXT85498.1 hypothetical protein C6I20_10050 [Aeromicrobium sp. A1-2]